MAKFPVRKQCDLLSKYIFLSKKKKKSGQKFIDRRDIELQLSELAIGLITTARVLQSESKQDD